MTDNVGATPGSGVLIATEELTAQPGVQLQQTKMMWGPHGSPNQIDTPTPMPVTLPQGLSAGGNVIGRVFGGFSTAKSSITRPGNATPYTQGAALSNSITNPALGLFSNVVRNPTGGSGIIQDLLVTTSNPVTPSTGVPLAGQLLLFDIATIAPVNDGAPLVISSSQILDLIAYIEFDFAQGLYLSASNTLQVRGLNLGFTTLLTNNLAYLVRVDNAYVPVPGEVLQFVLKVLQVD